MTTVRAIVQRAFRKVGVLAHDVDLGGAYAANGLDAFNEMLHGWKAQGVDISHSDLDMEDTFPLADMYREGTIYQLASRISPEYEMPPQFDADAWFRLLQADYATEQEMTIPNALLRPPSRAARESNLPLDN